MFNNYGIHTTSSVEAEKKELSVSDVMAVLMEWREVTTDNQMAQIMDEVINKLDSIQKENKILIEQLELKCEVGIKGRENRLQKMENEIHKISIDCKNESKFTNETILLVDKKVNQLDDSVPKTNSPFTIEACIDPVNHWIDKKPKFVRSRRSIHPITSLEKFETYLDRLQVEDNDDMYMTIETLYRNTRSWAERNVNNWINFIEFKESFLKHFWSIQLYKKIRVSIDEPHSYRLRLEQGGLNLAIIVITSQSVQSLHVEVLLSWLPQSTRVNSKSMKMV
ncbi:hypothetical protein FQA39_LY07548 [Lamprigera yunnana]|nr:hypothetical protein FQA39_LY07548 [Lamprigera yunnana]